MNLKEGTLKRGGGGGGGRGEERRGREKRKRGEEKGGNKVEDLRERGKRRGTIPFNQELIELVIQRANAGNI